MQGSFLDTNSTLWNIPLHILLTLMGYENISYLELNLSCVLKQLYFLSPNTVLLITKAIQSYYFQTHNSSDILVSFGMK